MAMNKRAMCPHGANIKARYGLKGREENMKKRAILGVALFLALLLACTPTAPPAPSPSAPVTTPGTLPSRPTATPAPADAAWDKVVAEAKKEGRVTIYSFNFLGDSAVALGRAFRNRYGIEVDVISGRGAEFLERLKTEQRVGKMMGDLMEGSNIHTRNLKLQGLTDSLADIPVLKEKDVWWIAPTFMDPDAHFLGFTRFYLSPWVNTRLVKSGDEPRSWYDLLQPQWRGKITMGDPNISNLLYYFVVFIEQKRLEPDYLKKLAAQDIVFSRGTVDSIEKVARGDVPIAMLSSPTEATTFIKEGVPIKAIDMKEGVVANLHAISLVKGSPHPNAGRLFVNWLLSEEGQKAWAEIRSIAVLRKSVPDPTHPGARIQPENALVLTAEAGERVSDAFRDKIYVPVFKR